MQKKVGKKLPHKSKVRHFNGHQPKMIVHPAVSVLPEEQCHQRLREKHHRTSNNQRLNSPRKRPTQIKSRTVIAETTHRGTSLSAQTTHCQSSDRTRTAGVPPAFTKGNLVNGAKRGRRSDVQKQG